MPVFQLENQDGEVTRSEEIEEAVLYFFPKAGTPGCTEQACSFSDRIGEFKDLDAKVIGVSNDSKKDLKAFQEEEGLEFDLLSDTDGKVSKKLGIMTKAGFPERTTFVIQNGVIQRIIQEVEPKQHVELAKESLNRR